MREFMLKVLENSQSYTVQEIILHILVATLIGGLIYASYKLSHIGAIYSRKFNTSLIVLTILTATVMTVIGNNVALSLGMVGALSIVRFRTAIKDSRDTVYIFWCIIVGISCGVGDYTVAATGSAITFIVLLLMGRIKNDNRILLVIKAERRVERDIESKVFLHFDNKIKLRVKNTTAQSIEMIYELTSQTVKQVEHKEQSIFDKLYELGGVQYVNMVTQNDEIGS